MAADLKCTFCSKPMDGVEQLFVGSGLPYCAICNECVDVCVSIQIESRQRKISNRIKLSEIELWNYIGVNTEPPEDRP